MIEEENGSPQTSDCRYHMRLPGFIIDEPIGLGDIIKHATRTLGIKPCGGCESRAAALNRWVIFTRK